MLSSLKQASTIVPADSYTMALPCLTSHDGRICAFKSSLHSWKNAGLWIFEAEVQLPTISGLEQDTCFFKRNIEGRGCYAVDQAAETVIAGHKICFTVDLQCS